MLSDEERMAIEHLKNYPINWLIETVNESAIKIILNLIEKQQKEIEELKDTRSIFNMGRRSYKNEIEDKIKEKIEEVDYKMIAHQDVRLAVKVALNSLLEKE